MLSIKFCDLYICVDIYNGTLKANFGVELENGEDEPVSSVSFILNKCLSVDSIKCIGRRADFTQKLTAYEDLENAEIKFIEVFFNEPLSRGDMVKLSIKYGGEICDYQDVFRYVKDNINEKFTLIRPDAYSYPQIGTLNFRKSIPLIVSQRFDYKIKVRVPREYVVANVGRLVNRIGFDDEVMYIYESRIPSWRIDIAIAKFKKISDMKEGIHVFAFEEDYEDAFRILSESKRTIKFYIDWFGPPPIWAGYTVIEIPLGWGGQADFAGMLVDEEVFKDPSKIPELYHELAHLWHIKSGEKYVSRFFDEGFASYLQLLAEREFIGEEHFNGRLKQLRDNFIRLGERNPRLFEVPISKYGEYMLTDASYYIGPYILYVLHSMIGDEKFKLLIKTLIRNFSESEITMKDFKNLVKEICGEKYGVFIDEWIFQSKPAQFLRNGMPLNKIISRYRMNN